MQLATRLKHQHQGDLTVSYKVLKTGINTIISYPTISLASRASLLKEV